MSLLEEEPSFARLQSLLAPARSSLALCWAALPAARRARNAGTAGRRLGQRLVPARWVPVCSGKLRLCRAYPTQGFVRLILFFCLKAQFLRLGQILLGAEEEECADTAVVWNRSEEDRHQSVVQGRGADGTAATRGQVTCWHREEPGICVVLLV